jgi:hypothetical protein
MQPIRKKETDMLSLGKGKKVETAEKAFDQQVKNAARHLYNAQLQKEGLQEKRRELVGCLLQSEDNGLVDQIQKNKSELDEIEHTINHFSELRDNILNQLADAAMPIFDARKSNIKKELADEKKSREALATEAGEVLGRFLEIADRLRFGLGNRVTRIIKEATTETLAHLSCQVANNAAAEKKEGNLEYYQHWQELQFINAAGPGDARLWAGKKARRALSRAVRELREKDDS